MRFIFLVHLPSVVIKDEHIFLYIFYKALHHHKMIILIGIFLWTGLNQTTPQCSHVITTFKDHLKCNPEHSLKIIAAFCDVQHYPRDLLPIHVLKITHLHTFIHDD